MHDDSWGDFNNKKLFLVCPTDNLEMLIQEKFGEEAFFYTALGGYFEFDIRTQSKLWELITQNNIEQLIYVSRLNNIFYQQALGQKRKCNYPVEFALAEIKRNISNQAGSQVEVFSNFHMLAAQHIANQKIRLLSSTYLGDRMVANNIHVNAYIYQANHGMFYSLSEIEQKANLFNNVSAN